MFFPYSYIYTGWTRIRVPVIFFCSMISTIFHTFRNIDLDARIDTDYFL